MIDWPKHARAIIERLGVTASYSNAGGPAVDKKVIYTEPYRASALGDGLIASSMPMATGMSADLPALEEDDTLEINATRFIVKDPQPDLTRGTVTMTLTKDG